MTNSRNDKKTNANSLCRCTCTTQNSFCRWECSDEPKVTNFRGAWRKSGVHSSLEDSTTMSALLSFYNSCSWFKFKVNNFLAVDAHGTKQSPTRHQRGRLCKDLLQVQWGSNVQNKILSFGSTNHLAFESLSECWVVSSPAAAPFAVHDPQSQFTSLAA